VAQGNQSPSQQLMSMLQALLPKSITSKREAWKENLKQESRMDEVLEILSHILKNGPHRPAPANYQLVPHHHEASLLCHQHSHLATFCQEIQSHQLSSLPLLYCNMIHPFSAVLQKVCWPSPTTQVQSRKGSHIAVLIVK